ncbi:MAG: zf-HC2 domain-containing protein [Candidatus Aureabacteria bacterium]|nr:zf-HC2 domain-containing protein [Candidatus Auribacterota bacterium]
MKCRKVKRLLSDYMDGFLDAESVGVLKEHFSRCSSCASDLKAMQRTRELISVKKAEYPPEAYWDGFWPRLRERLESEPLTARSWSEALGELIFSRRPLTVMAPAAAFVVAGLLIVSLFMSVGDRGREGENLARVVPHAKPTAALSVSPLFALQRDTEYTSVHRDLVLCGDMASAGVDQFVLQPVSPQGMQCAWPDTHYVLNRAGRGEISPAALRMY